MDQVTEYEVSSARDRREVTQIMAVIAGVVVGIFFCGWTGYIGSVMDGLRGVWAAITLDVVAIAGALYLWYRSAHAEYIALKTARRMRA